MADSIAEFARKVREALGLGGTAEPKQKRSAEVIEPTTARALEVTLSKPQYGHQYDAAGKDLGMARDLGNGPRTAPGKAGDTMSGPRTMHNPTALREKAPEDFARQEKPEDVAARTAEHLRRYGMQGVNYKNQAAPAPGGQEWDENGQPVHPYVRGPITVDNAWDQVTSAPADYLVAHGAELSPEHKESVSSAIAKAQAGTEKAASGVMQRTMKQVREKPGGEYGAQKGLELVQGGTGAIAKALHAVDPEVRESIQMEREFSNEEEKQRYLEAKKAGGK